MKLLKTKSTLTVKIIAICLPIFGILFTLPALAKPPVCSRAFAISYHKNVPEEEHIVRPNFLRKTFGKILGHDSRVVCCRPVKLSPAPIGLIPHSAHDPYIAGDKAYTLGDSNHSQLFQWSRPEKISGLKIYALKYVKIVAGWLDRIQDFLNKHPPYVATRLAGQGTFSRVFYLVSEKEVDLEGSEKVVVKFRREDLKTTASARRTFVRDIAIGSVAEELTRGATFAGKSFIRVAKDFSTLSDLSEGVRIQEAIHGLSAFQIRFLLNRLSTDKISDQITDQNETADKNEKIRAELKKYTDFDVSKPGELQELVDRIAGLEQFYREVHFDVLRFLKDNRLPIIENLTVSGDWVQVGLDFCYGKNVFWKKDEKLWVIIDE